jgi:hypothetical protein
MRRAVTPAFDTGEAASTDAGNGQKLPPMVTLVWKLPKSLNANVLNCEAGQGLSFRRVGAMVRAAFTAGQSRTEIATTLIVRGLTKDAKYHLARWIAAQL